jgi:hypothetical protein
VGIQKQGSQSSWCCPVHVTMQKGRSWQGRPRVDVPQVGDHASTLPWPQYTEQTCPLERVCLVFTFAFMDKALREVWRVCAWVSWRGIRHGSCPSGSWGQGGPGTDGGFSLKTPAPSPAAPGRHISSWAFLSQHLSSHL